MSRPTDDELVALVKFRDAIANFEMRPEERTTVALLAWLRARELNIAKATEMLKKSLLWRKENDIYNVLDWKAPEWFAEMYPYEICGSAKDGCPVLVMPVGRWNIKKAVDAGENENWLRFFDQMIARLGAEANKLNLKMGPDDYPISQFIIIVDYTGFSLRQMASIGSFQNIMGVLTRFDSNYPETLRAAYYLNAPRAFAVFFALVKPVMSGRTIGKINVFGTNEAKWIPELQKLISPDQLPLLLGGTKQNSCGFLAKDYVYWGPPEETSSVAEEPCLGACGGVGSENDEFIKAFVKAGQKLTLEFEITKRKTAMSFIFSSDTYDIGFSITRKGKEIVPFKKCDSHLCSEFGTITCEKTGTYIVTFDNTYSKFHGKMLHYTITLDEPDA